MATATALDAAPAGAASPVILVEGVGHVYKGGTVALEGVDLEIGTGLFGLLGPNGAGKSTLMRVLCTLLVPSSGRASVCGFDTVGARPEVRQRLGYLPQEFGAWRLQRVSEVLDSLALLSGLADRKQRRSRIEQVLEQVGLSDVSRRKVKKLSGGMVRRLGVAQALVHQPQVLVVDEPTVGLDPEERIRFRQLMADLGQERTILLSTHIVADLGSGCRRLALLDSGKVVFTGSPSELRERAKGSVLQLTVPRGGEDRLGPDLEIVSRSSVPEGVRLRVVVGSDQQRPDGAETADQPTLEEAYLAFMAARGRIEAATATDDTDEGAKEGAQQ